MNKTELIAEMVNQTELSKKDVEAVLNSFVDVVVQLNGAQLHSMPTRRTLLSGSEDAGACEDAGAPDEQPVSNNAVIAAANNVFLICNLLYIK